MINNLKSDLTHLMRWWWIPGYIKRYEIQEIWKSIQVWIKRQKNLLNSNYGLLFHSCIGLGSILAKIQEDHEKCADS